MGLLKVARVSDNIEVDGEGLESKDKGAKGKGRRRRELFLIKITT